MHGIVYVPEDRAPRDPLEKEGNASESVTYDYTSISDTPRTPLVKETSELLAQVKDEQGYIVVRERTHRNTAESTNSRVKWWSMFQIIVLIVQGGFQVWWLKRFFEVKSGPNFGKGRLG